MDTNTSGQPRDRLQRLSRRRLFGLAASAGAAVLGACARPVTETEFRRGRSSDNGTASVSPRPVTTTAASPPTTLVPAPARPVAASAVLLCREAWGAQPARAGGRPHTMTRMTLHHSAVVLGDNRNIIARLRHHQRHHQDQLGWTDIAYHMAVDRDGNLFELRDTAIAGDTDTNYDTTGHFLLLCEGNFEQEAVSEAQLQGAAHAFAWAAQRFRISSNTLAGHRDVNPGTACPGGNLYAHLTSGDLKGRIDKLLASGPVALQRVCGAEADAIVADIEAGRVTAR